MQLTKTFRENGAIGALLDEYEKAINELKTVTGNLTDAQLIQVIDPNNDDPDCVSIQSVLTHLVSSGYGYAIYVRNLMGETLPFPDRKKLNTTHAYHQALDEMFAYNVATFDLYPDIIMQGKKDAEKVHTRWGQIFDVDQLMEHAIMHIHRHRRQVERYMLKIT